MKFQPDSIQGPSISAYGDGWIEVDRRRVTSSIIISAQGIQQDWGAHSFDVLEAWHFDKIAEMDAEVVIFGSGKRIQFPKPAWLQSLYARRIGVETMDTPAACRTYNFLAAEGRRVVAALLL